MDAETPFVGLTIVDGTMTAGQVALAVLRKHFVAMLTKEAGTLESSDPEELHDMRVATRRIRAAMSLFKNHIHPDVAAFRPEFAWLGGVLGGVRDLDVQLGHVETWSKELPPNVEEALLPYRAALNARREKARLAIAEALCTERYSQLVGRFGALLLTGPMPDSDEPIVAAAPVLVESRMKSFRKAADGLNSDDPVEKFHLARISAKKLRYAVEFVAAVYGKPAKDAAAQVVVVQDLLGLHQDCVVARHLIDDVAASEPMPNPTMFALGMLAQFVESLAADLRAEFPRKLKDSRGREWRAFRDLMVRATPEAEAESEPGEPLSR